MTDREYLENAAKAAGIKGEYGYAPDDYYYEGNVEGILTYLPDGQSYVWNPITDSGQALELAVKLDLNVMIGVVRTPCGFTAIEYSETGGKDDNECTRRAIVRAAAEIGRSMK